MNINLLMLLCMCLTSPMTIAMDLQLSLNIGGHKFTILKSNPRLSESETLQKPTESPFFEGMDEEGNPFLNLCSEEGRVIEEYLHYGTLRKSDRQILKKTGEHFGLKEFPKLIADRFKMKDWGYEGCPLCGVYYDVQNKEHRIRHLVERHEATVHGCDEIQSCNRQAYIKIYYSCSSVPSVSHNLEQK